MTRISRLPSPTQPLRGISVKRSVFICLFLTLLVPAFGQNTTGLERWITGFTRGSTVLLDRKITRCVIEPTGASVVFDKTGTAVRLNIIKPLTLAQLAAKLGLVERTVLNDRELVTEQWYLTPRECEIDFGLKNELTITLSFSSFRFRLNQETILELAPKLAADPVFILPPDKDTFEYTIAYKDMDLGTGKKDVFPGWTAYVRQAVQWFEQGLNRTDQATLALVQEVKVLKMADENNIPKIVPPQTGKSNLWVGMTLDYLMSNLISSEHNGISFNPVGYNTLMPRICLSWRDLGDEAWIAKPYRFAVSLGGFFEFNATYFGREQDGYYTGYLDTNNSFMFAFGPALGVEFSAMVPRIINGKQLGDLFGAGLELLLVFNLPYFFPDYAYEYFLNAYVNVVIHLIPVNGIGLDVITGFNFAFTTEDFDAASGIVYLDRYAFSLGVRMTLDFHNFDKPHISDAPAKSTDGKPLIQGNQP